MTRITSGRLVVLLGIDGSGKTTILEHLKAYRPEWRYTSSSPNDLYPVDGLEFQTWTLTHDPKKYLKNMQSISRTIFFMQTLSFQYEYHIKPALMRGDTIVVDSYWYRLFIKDRLQNPQNSKLFSALTDLLPKPNLIILLNIDPVEAYYRIIRSRIPTFFETSPSGGLNGFQDFQSKVIKELNLMLSNLYCEEIDGMMPPVSIAHSVIRLVESIAD